MLLSKGGNMWPYPSTHVVSPSHLGHLDRRATTLRKWDLTYGTESHGASPW